MNRKLKAISLFEVLISLIVISLTIVSTLAIFVQVNLKLRENEITSSANGINIKAIELLKSPSDVLLSSQLPPVYPSTGAFYSLKFDTAQQKTYFQYISAASQTSNDLTTCTTTNQYYIDNQSLINDGSSLLICIRFKIYESSQLINGKRPYNIEIKTMYGVSSNILKTDTYETVRVGVFKLL